MKNDIQKISNLKEGLPLMNPGDTIRVSEKILEKSKKKSQVFEGILIAKKHGKGINATFTLRAIIDGIGVEKTYPLHSPLIEKIQIIKKGRARRAKLYYLREKAQKQIRKKLKSQIVIEEKEKEKPEKETNKKENNKKVLSQKTEENKETKDKKENNSQK